MMVGHSSGTSFTEELTGGAAAAARARELVCDQVGHRLDAARLHDLQLLTTELVTNAVRHAAVDESATLELHVQERTDRLHVSVTDPGGNGRPELKDLDATDPGGLGLFLVDSISSRWASERDGNGRTRVWFELDCA